MLPPAAGAVELAPPAGRSIRCVRYRQPPLRIVACHEVSQCTRFDGTAQTGHPCDPPQTGDRREDGKDWIGGNPDHYDREYCVDLAQLSAFLRETQPEVAEVLALAGKTSS